MNLKKCDPLIGILLGIASVLLIISGICGDSALVDINVEKIQLKSNGVVISALLLYPSDQKSQRPAILVYHGWGGTKENILPSLPDSIAFFTSNEVLLNLF